MNFMLRIVLAQTLGNTGEVTTLPLAEARDHLSELVDGVDRTHDRVTITRHGRPVAVVLSPDDLAEMEETLAILAVPGALEEIKAGLRDFERGQVEDWEDVKAEFGQ
jgi:antitoxin YefM